MNVSLSFEVRLMNSSCLIMQHKSVGFTCRSSTKGLHANVANTYTHDGSGRQIYELIFSNTIAELI